MSAPAVTRTAVLTRAGLRTQSQSRARSHVAARFFGFLTLTAVVYVVATLSGQVFLEKARRDSIWSLARAQEARQVETVLQKQVDRLSSLATIAGWAKSNGFVAPDAPIGSSQEVSRVASRF